MADKDPTRSSEDVPGKKSGVLRPSVERAMALRDVLTHAVALAKESRKHSGPRQDPSSGRVVAVALSISALVFSVYSFVARPEFIWGPSPSSVTSVQRDANLRFTMFLLSQRIRSQGAATGRLPASLADVHENPLGITYTVVSDTVFELRAVEAGMDVVLRSDEPPQRFLGDAQKVIAGRAQ